MSPASAAASALVGKLADVREVVNHNVQPAKASPKVDVDADTSQLDSDEDIERLYDLPKDQDDTNPDAPKASLGLPKFTVLKGIGAPLERSNVDTGTSCLVRIAIRFFETCLGKNGSQEIPSRLGHRQMKID